MKISKMVFSFLLLGLMGIFLSGCELLIVGAGKDATAEDTGFFQNYDGLLKGNSDPNYPNLPDLWYLAPDVKQKLTNYKKILVSDFTALTKNPNDLLSIGNPEFKTIKKDLPDSIVDTLEGAAIFPEVVRISEKIGPKNIDAIKKLTGDAVLMGNIKELMVLGGAAATQVEIKLVDVKTGEEVLKFINRGVSDSDKVALATVTRTLPELINKAKGSGGKQ